MSHVPSALYLTTKVSLVPRVLEEPTDNIVFEIAEGVLHFFACGVSVHALIQGKPDCFAIYCSNAPDDVFSLTERAVNEGVLIRLDKACTLLFIIVALSMRLSSKPSLLAIPRSFGRTIVVNNGETTDSAFGRLM